MPTTNSDPRPAGSGSAGKKDLSKCNFGRVRKAKPTPAMKLRALRKAAELRRAKRDLTANGRDGEATQPSAARSKLRLPTRRALSPTRPVPHIEFDNINGLQKLGEGNFARVLSVRVHNNGKGSVFAIKIYSKEKLAEDPVGLASANKERKALHDLPWSTWICSAVDVFQDDDDLHLLLEYMPITLVQRMYQNSGPLDAVTARFYYCNIACALEFLHDHYIVHHDLKPENILVKPDGYLCLVDFGGAVAVEDYWSAYKSGTTPYMAPEKFDEEQSYGYAVDWWASGVILYEMLTLHLPFYVKESVEGTEECIRKGQYDWPSNMYVGKVVESFVSELLQMDPNERLGCIIPVKEHPWLFNVDWDVLESHGYRASWTPPDKYDILLKSWEKHKGGV